MNYWLTPAERLFVRTRKPALKDRIKYSWGTAAMEPLLWALGEIDTMPAPVQQPPAIVEPEPIFMAAIETDFENLCLRPVSQILDELDLAHRQDSLCKRFLRDGLPPPEGVDNDILIERRYALDWLIDFDGAEWGAADEESAP